MSTGSVKGTTQGWACHVYVVTGTGTALSIIAGVQIVTTKMKT
jgi:hypothetical protein